MWKAVRGTVTVVSDDPSPFRVTEPTLGESPVLVEVPHAGLWVDPESMAFTVAPTRSIGRDADLFVDALFEDAAKEGATLLTSRLSRLVVDLNRAEDQVDADAAEGGGSKPHPRGLVWRLTTEGAPVLRAPLPAAELTRRLDTVYRPYHAALEAILRRKRRRFGYAILLCAHSMPAYARRDRRSPRFLRADVVPGTQGRTSAAAEVIDAVDRHARARGWTVSHDDPYRGGFSTRHYGRPGDAWHAVQIELSRRLYMDEDKLTRLPGDFEGVRDFARTLVARLSEVTLPGGTSGEAVDEARSRPPSPS